MAKHSDSTAPNYKNWQCSNSMINTAGDTCYFCGKYYGKYVIIENNKRAGVACWERSQLKIKKYKKRQIELEKIKKIKKYVDNYGDLPTLD